jgi:hypothetical protein
MNKRIIESIIDSLTEAKSDELHKKYEKDLPDTVDGESTKLGQGGRFNALVNKLMREEGYSKERAEATAASIGRKKYGKKKFQDMAAKGN